MPIAFPPCSINTGRIFILPEKARFPESSRSWRVASGPNTGTSRSAICSPTCSKLAGEALIQAYCEGYGFEGYIFRFVSILGERYTHGHVLDFFQQLRAHPDYLRVLGDGTQKKSYLYVHDCIDAMRHVIELGSAKTARHRAAIYNLGTTEFCQVTDSIAWISEHLGVRPRLEFSGGDRGWIGDNPFIFLDTKKIQSTGWKPRLTIREGVIRTLKWLQANQSVFEKR